VIRSTSCLVLGRVFGDGGSNGAIYGSNKSKMAATAMLEKFEVAISPQPVVRSTTCFVLGWVFGDGGSMALFSIRTNSRWRPPPSWIISNGHISATAHNLLIQRASRGHLCDSTAFLSWMALVDAHSVAIIDLGRD